VKNDENRLAVRTSRILPASYHPKLSRALLAFLVLAALATTLWGQGASYLTGFVTDPTQAAVPGATIVIKNQQTGNRYEVKSTATGVYRSPDLAPGVYDVIAAPTFAGHLAPALERLLDSGATGLYHAVNAGPVSWYDLAREALDRAGIDWPIEPISGAQWKAGARRPRFSALSNAKLEGLGISMPSWRQGVSSYLELVSRP